MPTPKEGQSEALVPVNPTPFMPIQHHDDPPPANPLDDERGVRIQSAPTAPADEPIVSLKVAEEEYEYDDSDEDGEEVVKAAAAVKTKAKAKKKAKHKK